jgi:hypothetical protein
MGSDSFDSWFIEELWKARGTADNGITAKDAKDAKDCPAATGIQNQVSMDQE